MPVTYTKPPPKAAAPESEYDTVLEGKVAVVTTEKQKFQGKDPSSPKSTKTEHIPLPPAPGAVCVIRFGVGRTVNLGDYESVKIYVGIDHPSGLSGPEIEAVYDKITTWAGDKLNEAYEAAKP